MEFIKIGFLGIYHFEDAAAIRGAMLVTDAATKPLEFRVTAPVRPQKFQKMLYGELLEEHVSVELMGIPLIDALQQKPDLIIVRDALLLGLNSRQDTPTIFLLKEDEPLFKKGVATKPIESLDSRHAPVKVCTSGQFESKVEEISRGLQEIFRERDLMEPFVRLEKACEDVHTRNVGDK